jgi:hypothetical protein
VPIVASALAPTFAASVTAPAVADRLGIPPEVAASPTRVWMSAYDAAGAWWLVSIDRATGAWAESISLGALRTVAVPGPHSPAPVHVAVQDDRLVASWLGTDAVLRSLVLDTTGVVLARTVVPLAPRQSQLWVGSADAGAWALLGDTAQVQLVEPCVDR